MKEKPKYTDPVTGKFAQGNPGGGRPKGFSIVAHLKEMLQEIPAGQKETYATLVTKKYMHKAIVEGDPTILKDLINRTDGLPLQTLANADGEAFKINLVNYIQKDQNKGSPNK